MKNPVKAVIFIAFLWTFFLKALGLSRKEKPAVVHANWWLPAGIIGLLVAKINHRPLIISIHGTDLRLLNNLRFLRPIARRVFLQTQIITTASSFLKEKIVHLLGIAGDKILVIPTPLKLPVIPTRPRKTEHQIIAIARLSQQKGIKYLIEAGDRLHRQNFDFKLVVIGDGEERKAIERQIATLGLQKHVRLLGALPHTEIYQHLLASEVFVLPSIEEGFGVVVLEAMACGIPVIGSDSGGIPDLIQDHKTGRLVPVRDPEALARVIREVLVDTAAAQRYARHAYARLRQTFTVETVATQMHCAYLKTISLPRRFV